MSRAVTLDYEFDKDAFTALLIKAKAGKKQIDFANEIGVSKGYLCKYLNGRFEKPPVPSTLKKIADHCDNRVSFAELLQAAGYSPEKYFASSNSNAFLNFDGNLRSYSLSLITTAIDCYMGSTLDRDKMMLTFKEDIYAAMVIFEDKPYSFWQFIPFSPIEDDENSITTRELTNYIGNSILNDPASTKSVYTFVTDSETTYQSLKKMSFPTLISPCSVMLVNTDNNSLIKYSFLKTAFTLEENVEKTYSL